MKCPYKLTSLKPELVQWNRLEKAAFDLLDRRQNDLNKLAKRLDRFAFKPVRNKQK